VGQAPAVGSWHAATVWTRGGHALDCPFKAAAHRGRSQFWSQSPPFASVRHRSPPSLLTLSGFLRTPANVASPTWKAGWVHALTSSNLVSSAVLTRADAGPACGRFSAARRLVSVLVSVVLARDLWSAHNRPPTWSATVRRMGSVTCWYRAAIAVLDQPMIPITVGSGTPGQGEPSQPCAERHVGERRGRRWPSAAPSTVDSRSWD